MTNPDYRALCAELVELSAPTDSIPQLAERLQKLSELASRARAALAQPEPVAPTDEEIMELMPQQMRDDLATAARALAGFDRATVKAAGAMRIILNRHAVNHARAVLARWGRPAIQPVPVSERLPGAKDCNAEGRCWFWHPGHKQDDFIDGWILLDPKWAGSRRDSDDSLIYTHWLPHHAIPTPRRKRPMYGMKRQRIDRIHNIDGLILRARLTMALERVFARL